MKNSSDTIGNRTRDLLACSAVPQPTALPRAPIKNHIALHFPSEYAHVLCISHQTALTCVSFSGDTNCVL